MPIDKDGLAAAARALYALEHSCQAPEDMSPPYSPKSKIGLAIGGAEAAIAAYLSALPDTGDELVARLRRAVIDGMDWAGTMPAKDAVKVRPKDWHAICDTAREASDAIASLTARAQAAEASLASAREDAIDDTAAAQWLRTWVKRKFGVWITWRTAWSAIKEMRAQPTALNKDVR